MSLLKEVSSNLIKRCLGSRPYHRIVFLRNILYLHPHLFSSKNVNGYLSNRTKYNSGASGRYI